jgi:hypothetical protein
MENIPTLGNNLNNVFLHKEEEKTDNFLLWKDRYRTNLGTGTMILLNISILIGLCLAWIRERTLKSFLIHSLSLSLSLSLS